jgi:hypothetical protein
MSEVAIEEDRRRLWPGPASFSASGLTVAPGRVVDGRKPPPENLQDDPAHEPPEEFKGIKGG